MWKQSLTATAAALLAAVLAATATAAQARPVIYHELTPERQAEVAQARVDLILADTTRFGKVRRRHAHLLSRGTVDGTDDRGRMIAFEALIRAFEEFEAWMTENEVPRMVGVPLRHIDAAFTEGGEKPEGPGREYTWKVFRTWEPPPRKLSEDAARWWNLCWDERFSEG